MKVIFLDIDGVLKSYRTAVAYGDRSWSGDAGIRAKMDDVAIRLIDGIARQAGASIVLSSSWRNDRDWEAIGPALGLEIIDRTPNHCSRGEEIQQWLGNHRDVECYAIVDDEVEGMLPEQQPYFVHTNQFDGFTWSNATQLARILGINIYDVNRPV